MHTTLDEFKLKILEISANPNPFLSTFLADLSTRNLSLSRIDNSNREAELRNSNSVQYRKNSEHSKELDEDKDSNFSIFRIEAHNPFRPQRKISFGTLEVTINSNSSLISGSFESNDTIQQATDTGLSSSNPGSETFSSTLGNNRYGKNDVDIYEFQLNAGDRVKIDVDAALFGSSLDSVLRLFDSQGKELARSDDTSGPGELFSRDPYIEFTASTSGNYYVGVSSWANFDYNPNQSNSGNGRSSGGYALEMTIENLAPKPSDLSALSDFDIDVIFTDNSLTPSQQAVFTNAANRWEQIIIGDLPGSFVTGIGFVDDVAIEASAPFIDGPGRILGSARPTYVRSDSLLPVAGRMEFDSADVEQLEDNGQLEQVILHEIGHVLGIGTLWPFLGLLDGAGTSNPRFRGPRATAEYNSIFDQNDDSVPVENTGGRGTRDGHWRESVFGNELMTGFLNSGNNPLSRVTAASLADMGYQVNLAAADPYEPT